MKKDGFASKIGVVMATAASAVGLGNIWKFPYMTGQNGGAAFLLVYLLCILLLGLPVMLCEFSVGMNAQSGIKDAFKKLSNSNRWNWMGTLYTITAVMLLGFYLVVSGWCLGYLVQAAANRFAGITEKELVTNICSFAFGTWKPLIFTAISSVFTAMMVWKGVQKGIERTSKIMMPLLLILLVILAIRGIHTDVDWQGLKFFFVPDFSLITGSVVLNALGQCFFSLSIGVGVMITYGAYTKPNSNMLAISGEVIGIDTLVAIMAGVAIFPAVFALGVSPTEGPQLIFITLPLVFQQMNAAYLTTLAFFLLIYLAAITSTISLLELTVSHSMDKRHWSRHKSIIVWSIVTLVVACLSSLSISDQFYSYLTFGPYTIYEWLDALACKILLPLGGLFISIFVGWVVPRDKTESLLRESCHLPNWLIAVFFFVIRYIVPLFILLIFSNGLGIIG